MATIRKKQIFKTTPPGLRENLENCPGQEMSSSPTCVKKNVKKQAKIQEKEDDDDGEDEDDDDSQYRSACSRHAWFCKQWFPPNRDVRFPAKQGFK